MLKRHSTATLLNTIVNHPEVVGWVKGDFKGEHLDISPLVTNFNNVCLMGKYGGVLFIQHQIGLYEAHTVVLPEGRGRWTLDMVNEAVAWMFTQTEAVELTTRIPKGNLGARALVRSIHAELEFRNENGWTFEGESVYADIFSLTIQRWMKTAPNLVEKGQWFHHRLEEEFKKHRYTEPQHPDDLIHDRYVGAAVAMVTNGQPQKGVVMYNRWAVMAKYTPISIVTLSPLVLDIGNALLSVRGKDFWMISPRLH